MTVRFDAYTATMLGPKPDDLAQLLFDQVGIGGKWSKGRGFHQFGERLSARSADGHEVGAVSYGGRQGELVMIEVKGSTLRRSWRPSGRVTRTRSHGWTPAPISTLLGRSRGSTGPVGR